MSNVSATAPTNLAVRLKRYLRNPKGLLIAVLGGMVAVAALGTAPSLLAPGLLGAMLGAILLDLPLLRLRKKKWVFPDGALLTGLIVAMILSPQAPWYVGATASAAAVGSKYIFRAGTANVFNPAALGLVAAYFLFHSGQSWWGALPDLAGSGAEAASVLVLVGTGLMVGNRVQRLPAALGFLGVHYLLFTITAYVADPEPVAAIFRASDLHAAIFCAFFMVTDPPTSPAKPRDQIYFGALAAAVSFAVCQLFGTVLFFLAGVLVANLWEALRRRQRRAARHSERTSVRVGMAS